MAEQLFVYGTLKQSFGNPFARLLHIAGHFIGRGTVNGRLYRLKNYPGLVSSNQPGEHVHGEVYHINRNGLTWEALDSYEGCGKNDLPPFEFERQQLSVLMEDGARITANAYIYQGVPDECSRIVNGLYNPPGQH